MITKNNLTENLDWIKKELDIVDMDGYNHQLYAQTHKIYYSNDDGTDKIIDVSIFKKDLSDYSVNSISLALIDAIYKDKINDRSAIIKGSKGYYERKIKSLELWQERGHEDKCKKIVNELIAKRILCNTIKTDVQYYKQFVSNLYKVKQNAEMLEDE